MKFTFFQYFQVGALRLNLEFQFLENLEVQVKRLIIIPVTHFTYFLEKTTIDLNSWLKFFLCN